MRSAIQTEQRDRFFLLVIDDEANGIAARRTDLETMFHSSLQRLHRMRFQKPEHLDEFASSLAAELSFQTSPQNAERHGQIPVFQRPSVIETARFSL